MASIVTTDPRVGRSRGKGIVYAFLAPAVVIYSVFFVYPSLDALYIALFDWSGFNWPNAEFVGAGNFIKAYGDKWVWLSLWNTLYLVVFGGILIFVLVLIFSGMLTNRNIRGRNFFRVTIFLPYVINSVALGLLWIFIFNSKFGMLNMLLKTIGLENFALVWLGSRGTALACIVFVVVWSNVGFYLILLVAGIETVPKDLYDAGQVDGASSIQGFRFITIPLIREVLVVAGILWTIGALKEFGVAWMLTRGSPAQSTHTFTTYLMNEAMPYQAEAHMGYASALAVALLIVVVGVSGVLLALRRREAIEF